METGGARGRALTLNGILADVRGAALSQSRGLANRFQLARQHLFEASAGADISMQRVRECKRERENQRKKETEGELPSLETSRKKGRTGRRVPKEPGEDVEPRLNAIESDAEGVILGENVVENEIDSVDADSHIQERKPKRQTRGRRTRRAANKSSSQELVNAEVVEQEKSVLEEDICVDLPKSVQEASVADTSMVSANPDNVVQEAVVQPAQPSIVSAVF